MEFAIAFGVSALLQALEDSKAVQRYAAKFAKLFVAIERYANQSPVLMGAIIAARTKR